MNKGGEEENTTNFNILKLPGPEAPGWFRWLSDFLGFRL